MMQQVQEQTAKLGVAMTAGAGVTSFVTKAIPILQAISLTVSIIVGCLTAAWYGVRFYDKWKSKRG